MKKFVILIPVFNDWKSVSRLLLNIDSEISNWEADVSLIIVNDASTEKKSGMEANYKKIKSIKILNMKENRVHQRCIAAGLKYICENENFDRVIVMDADGEDRPEELSDFYKKSEEYPDMTITGNRYKRSEGVVFKLLYEIHKLITLIFTGKLIKFGNFTCLPKKHVQELLQKPHLWNSYSSSIVKTIKDRIYIHSVRGTRYVLPSKMNFFALIFHSLAIISVFSNLVVIRSIILSLVYFLFFYNNFSIFFFIPIFFLILFVFTILKISRRANMEGLNNSLKNIDSIDVLNDFSGR